MGKVTRDTTLSNKEGSMTYKVNMGGKERVDIRIRESVNVHIMIISTVKRR